MDTKLVFITISAFLIPQIDAGSTKQPGASASSSSPRQNFYNYRTDYDDDQNYSFFEGDTAGNFVSDFGLRTNKPSARVANPFEIFGNNELGSSSRSGSNLRSRNSRNDYEEDDYNLLDTETGDLDGSVVNNNDQDYDDYQDQQEGSPPIVESRRLQEGGMSRGRSRYNGGGGAGWSGSTSLTTSRRPGDASYSFGYSLLDQSRYEYSDPLGNIRGYYSYIDDEGILHGVSYTAGAGTGFVVNQNRVSHHHPYHPPPPHRARPSSTGIPDSPPPSGIKVSIGGVGGGGWNEQEEDVYQSQGHRIPSSPQRQPAQGGWPSRRRKPSYVVKIRRPVRPTDPPAWIYFRPPNPGRLAPGRGSGSGGSSGGWRQPARRPQVSRPTKVYPDEDLDGGSGGGGGDGWSDSDSSTSSYPKDASYHFAYDAGSHNRNEYSDPWGNVRGSYSYIDPTGVRRTVHYSAGSATGFKILNASPSQIVNRVYQDGPLPPAISKIRQKPSAIVYHLHPDSGWKPWEASETNIISRRPRPQKSNPNQIVSQSYQYQSPNTGKKDESVAGTASNEDLNQEPKPMTNSRNNNGEKPTRHRSKPNRPRQQQQHQPHVHEQYHRQKFDSQPQQQNYDDQDFSNDHNDEEYQVAEAKYEALKTNHENGKVTTIHGYKGGYGDKNPLLVMSESSTRPRESSTGPSKNHDETHMNNNNMNDESPSTSRPMSVARMMSMRMSKSRKMMRVKPSKSGSNDMNDVSNGGRRKGSTSMNNHHSSSALSQSQSYHHDEDEVQVQSPPIASSPSHSHSQPHSNQQQHSNPHMMMIMSQERRLAHYPKSFNKNNPNVMMMRENSRN